MQPPFVWRMRGRATHEGVKAGETREDSLADTKRQFEQKVEADLLAVWREFGHKFLQYLREHREVQGKGLVNDVLGLAVWKDFTQALTGVLLPSIEDMMHTAVGNAIDVAMPATISVDRDGVHADVADWARKHAGDLIDGIDKTTKRRVRVNLVNWIEAGEPLSALEKRMTSIFEAPWRAKMIAVTETTRAFAYANEETWRSSEVIKYKRWNTARDGDVCTICEPLDGEVARVGHMFVSPETGERYRNPGDTHPRCRCWTTPVVD